MIVADSSAWIEWLVDSPVASHLRLESHNREDLFVPTIVQHEVYKWLRREVSSEAADGFLALSRQYRVVPLTTTIAVESAEVCRLHKLPMADAVIYATALHVGAGLLTCDAHFKGLDKVVYLARDA